MRALFLAYRDSKNPSSVGGDFYLWELAKGLSRIGHQVTFVSSMFEGSRESEVIDGVEVVRVKGGWRLSLRVFGEYMRRLKGKFDVVVEEAIGGQRLPFFAGVYVREPLIAVWHQRHGKIFREQYHFPIAVFLSLFELFLARLYRNRVIVTPSKGAREKLMQLGFNRDNVKVVYDGVGEIFYNAKTSENREDVIVCLGKLRRYKRPDHAILALAHVLKNAKRICRLVIAGKVSEIDRGYVDELQNLAERLGISNYVDFRFNISEIEKLKLLEKARVLVQPSPVEGFSIVVIEANRCGTPVVVSNGVPEDVVINNYNGIVYSFGNIEALSVALTMLLNDKVIWNRISKNAISWAQNFTWENSVSKFDFVLNEVLSSKGFRVVDKV
ncbi:MAG: glycosyltransferase family 4 protein [Candidatus Bathyarchaeia archaeon]